MNKPSGYNEYELSLLLIKGDEQAFEYIYHQYSRKIYGVLLKLLKSEMLAQELLQESFVKLWESRMKIDPKQSLQAYLYGIARNLVYDFFRKTTRDQKLQDEILKNAVLFYDPLDESLLQEENEETLKNLIKNLPPQRQQVFILCKLEKKSYREVSELLGISTSTISDHIVKAMRFLKEGFKGIGDIISIIFLK